MGLLLCHITLQRATWVDQRHCLLQDRDLKALPGFEGILKPQRLCHQACHDQVSELAETGTLDVVCAVLAEGAEVAGTLADKRVVLHPLAAVQLQM